MKYKTVIENLAKQDLRETTEWYEMKQKGLGKRFLTATRKEIKKIIPFPYSTQIRYSEVHTIIVKDFPFMVHYYIDDYRKSIIVIGVLHTSINPESWKNRL
jgi:plasmid stabilization system protein ParE